MTRNHLNSKYDINSLVKLTLLSGMCIYLYLIEFISLQLLLNLETLVQISRNLACIYICVYDFFLFVFIFRYGLPDKPLELGRVTPGTYCTRQFDECYRNKCHLQSPNYPGMYPRNVTCYWTIRQKEVPTSKHAMIAVSQENQHKALVKR